MFKKIEKYVIVHTDPIKSYGGSTGDPPIQVNSKKILNSKYIFDCFTTQYLHDCWYLLNIGRM